MRSVADELRSAQLRSIEDLSPGERMELVSRMSEEGIALFMKMHAVDRPEAIRRMRRTRAEGRRPSRCMSEE
jgi:hypothetical protein